MPRDDFSKKTKRQLAERVAHRCSYPKCGKTTIGPRAGSSDGIAQVGQAAHITAASPRGARYESSLTSAQRKHIDNGIWMCALHATEVDRDEGRYPKDLLLQWKAQAEAFALQMRQGTNHVPSQPQMDIDALLNESFARCAKRWMALGIDATKADELAKDQRIGLIPIENARFDTSILILQGPLGAGKSLALERLYQNALHESLKNSEIAIPLFLKAENAIPFENVVLKHCQQIGISAPLKMTIFIDGMDEISRSDAEELLNSIRYRILSWTTTKIMLTSRPLAELGKPHEILGIPELTEEAAEAIIIKVLGLEHPYNRLWIYPTPIREAVKRPFFAILLAAYKLNQSAGTYLATSELLDWLVDHAIKHTKRTRPVAQQYLERLAKKSIDTGGKSVHLQDVGTLEDLEVFLKSGLVEKNGQHIRFSLPILVQWFAARSLESGIASIEEIAKTPRQLDRWRYPIGMLVSKSNFETITRILEPIAANDIGFIGIILSDALSLNHFSPSGETLPDEAECVRRIGIAMDVMTRGLPTIGSKISPVRSDGRTRTLWAKVNQHHLTVGWADYEYQKQMEALGYHRDVVGFEGGGRSGHIDTRQDGWVWELVKDRLTSSLETQLKQRTLNPDFGPIAEEKFWMVALAYTELIHELNQPIGIISMFGPIPESIPFDSYFHFIEYDLDAVSVSIKDVKYVPLHIKKWKDRLREQGITEARAPWSLPDQLHVHTGWVHNWYSDEQMIARTQQIYMGALEAYQQLVSLWFPEFRNRLTLAATLPAKLIGLMERDEMGPIVGWRFEPLPRDQQSCVSVSFGDKDFYDVNLAERLRVLRPEAAEWIYPITYTEVIRHYTNDKDPMTKLAYEWLEDDLKYLHWL